MSLIDRHEPRARPPSPSRAEDRDAADFARLVDCDAVARAGAGFRGASPFDHAVVDGFFRPETAEALAGEFPDFDSEIWHRYDNAIEIKKTCNDWNRFPPATYRAFAALNAPALTAFLGATLLGGMPLWSDPGLNGGGWHIHGRGGKLNTHLDYSLHPKLGLQRKLNVIVYLNPAWRDEWGGHLGLWHAHGDEAPGPLAKRIAPRFNRAVIFDTTQNSWHGLPEPLTCPDDQYRKSLAIYYLCEPPPGVDRRGKALFAPTEEQADDPAVRELIRRRAGIRSAETVYRKTPDAPEEEA